MAQTLNAKTCTDILEESERNLLVDLTLSNGKRYNLLRVHWCFLWQFTLGRVVMVTQEVAIIADTLVLSGKPNAFPDVPNKALQKPTFLLDIPIGCGIRTAKLTFHLLQSAKKRHHRLTTGKLRHFCRDFDYHEPACTNPLCFSWRRGEFSDFLLSSRPETT